MQNNDKNLARSSSVPTQEQLLEYINRYIKKD